MPAERRAARTVVIAVAASARAALTDVRVTVTPSWTSATSGERTTRPVPLTEIECGFGVVVSTASEDRGLSDGRPAMTRRPAVATPAMARRPRVPRAGIVTVVDIGGSQEAARAAAEWAPDAPAGPVVPGPARRRTAGQRRAAPGITRPSTRL